MAFREGENGRVVPPTHTIIVVRGRPAEMSLCLLGKTKTSAGRPASPPFSERVDSSVDSWKHPVCVDSGGSSTNWALVGEPTWRRTAPRDISDDQKAGAFRFGVEGCPRLGPAIPYTLIDPHLKVFRRSFWKNWISNKGSPFVGCKGLLCSFTQKP